MTAPRDTAPELPTPARQTMAERYGVGSPHTRRLAQVGIVVLAVALLAWVGWAAWHHSRTAVTAQLQEYDVVTPHEVRVVVVISRHDGQPVVCDVRAQSEDHATVGESEISVPAGGADQVRKQASVRTEREATSVTVSQCRSPD